MSLARTVPISWALIMTWYLFKLACYHHCHCQLWLPIIALREGPHVNVLERAVLQALRGRSNQTSLRPRGEGTRTTTRSAKL